MLLVRIANMPRLGAWGDERWTRVRGSGWRQLVPSHCLCLLNMTARRHQPPELLRGWDRAAVGRAGAQVVLEGFYPGVQGMGWRVKKLPLPAANTDVPSEHCTVVLKSSWPLMPTFSLPAAFTSHLGREKCPANN